MHSPSLLRTHLHLYALTFTCIHSTSLECTHAHLYSLTFICMHSSSLVCTHPHFYALTFTFVHSPSLVFFTCMHLPSLLFTHHHWKHDENAFIIENGTFPTEWNIGVIKPIYKQKGDKKSPANYRGITLTSCLGKLITSILQNRLNKFIEQHNVLNPEQFWFRPNSRTTDSLFIFQQLLHNYTKNHKKLYVGFIDYEKNLR